MHVFRTVLEYCWGFLSFTCQIGDRTTGSSFWKLIARPPDTKGPNNLKLDPRKLPPPWSGGQPTPRRFSPESPGLPSTAATWHRKAVTLPQYCSFQSANRKACWIHIICLCLRWRVWCELLSGILLVRAMGTNFDSNWLGLDMIPFIHPTTEKQPGKRRKGRFSGAGLSSWLLSAKLPQGYLGNRTQLGSAFGSKIYENIKLQGLCEKSLLAICCTILVTILCTILEAPLLLYITLLFPLLEAPLFSRTFCLLF